MLIFFCNQSKYECFKNKAARLPINDVYEDMRGTIRRWGRESAGSLQGAALQRHVCSREPTLRKVCAFITAFLLKKCSLCTFLWKLMKITAIQRDENNSTFDFYWNFFIKSWWFLLNSVWVMVEMTEGTFESLPKPKTKPKKKRRNGKLLPHSGIKQHKN